MFIRFGVLSHGFRRSHWFSVLAFLASSIKGGGPLRAGLRLKLYYSRTARIEVVLDLDKV